VSESGAFLVHLRHEHLKLGSGLNLESENDPPVAIDVVVPDDCLKAIFIISTVGNGVSYCCAEDSPDHGGEYFPHVQRCGLHESKETSALI